MDTAMVDAFHALLSSDAVTHFSTSMYERLGGLLPLLPCTWRAMYSPMMQLYSFRVSDTKVRYQAESPQIYST